MGDSIAAAVRATLQSSPQPTGWLILPGDLPLIRSDTLRQIGEALGRHQVVVPVYRKRRGHPVGFSMCCRSELLDLKGNEGARNVVLAYEAIELMVDDIGCVTDIDTVADLHAVEKLLNGMAPLAADTFLKALDAFQWGSAKVPMEKFCIRVSSNRQDVFRIK